MLSYSMFTPFLFAIALLLTVTDSSLSSLKLELPAISVVPASQPDAPLSSPPNLSPNMITPLFPSPAESSPTIPSNPSTHSHSPEDSQGPNSASSPSGSFGAAASISGGAPLSVLFQSST
ncbi:hypothetical protein AAC387_Pa03g2178 [Persea americana]